MPQKRKFNIEEVRRDFPIFNQQLSKGRKLCYLDTGASAQKPLAVIDKEQEVYTQYYANAYRGVYEFGNRIDEELEQAREIVRNWLHAESTSEIIFTSGTTMSLNMVARSWGGAFLNHGDEILINQMEHHANIVPWQMIAKEKGAVLKYLPLTADGLLDTSRLDEFVTSRTKIISVTGMSNMLGTKPPIELLSTHAKNAGAIFVVDAAQLIPHAQIDVQKLGIDFLAFSGHKAYGPSGIGVLYGRQALLEKMNPFMGGGHMIERVYPDHSTWAYPPAKFEAGTIPIAQAIALGTAFHYLDQFNLQEIHAHEQRIIQLAYELLIKLPGITIYGPEIHNRGPILSFTIRGGHPEDLAQLLNKHGVFVRHGHHCTMPLHDLFKISATVRISLGLYNNEEDIHQLHEALQSAMKKLRLL